MGAETSIAWCDHTFNPVWGCTKISPGCANCYAATLAKRYGHDVWGTKSDRRTFGEKHWAEPLKWNLAAEKANFRRRVFCGSMCDIFEDHSDTNEQRERLWPLIRATPWLDWLLLTKRPERMAECLPDGWYGCPYNNVWLGVSIEDDRYRNRAKILENVPAVVRFVSYEPALGPLDLHQLLDGIDWVICGGESGPGFRPMKLEWAQRLYRQCAETGPAFFFKQYAGPRPGMMASVTEPAWLGAPQQFPTPRRGGGR